MILIDTNVLSEAWRPHPDPGVMAWIDAQAIETLFLTAVTVAEIRFGIAAMPVGKRQAILHERFERQVMPLFTARVLPFDVEASQAYAVLMSEARASGKAISTADGLIAAIARARNFAIATRDTEPFEAAGVQVINPWRG